MFRKSILWRIAAVVLLVAILTGCGGAQPQPSLEPTVDTKPTMDAIKTQAVETAVMDMTLKAPTATPVLPTATALPPTEAPTLAPTDTPVPVIPTAVPTNTRVPATLAPLPTATSASYNCTITDSSPEFGWDIRPGGDFDGKWVVKNTGSDIWSASEVDIKYIGGTKFQEHVDAMDLSGDVAKNGTYTIIVDMLAPNDTGRYSTTWAVVRGGQTLCVLPLTIDVVK